MYHFAGMSEIGHQRTLKRQLGDGLASAAETRVALRASFSTFDAWRQDDALHLLRRSVDCIFSSPLAAEVPTIANGLSLEDTTFAFSRVLAMYCLADERQMPLGADALCFDEEAFPLDGTGLWRAAPSRHAAEAFLWRLQRRLNLDEACLIYSLILLERVMKMRRGEQLCGLFTARTWRSALITAAILSTKVLYDEKVYLGDFRSALPEFRLEHIGAAEIKFLQLIGFRTLVSSQEYARYYYALRDCGGGGGHFEEASGRQSPLEV